jgi:deoxyribodipyrimidine photo-lyase
MQPDVMVAPPDGRWSAPEATSVAGRDVWLLHPWSLGAVPQGVDAEMLVLGVGLAECHAQTPWSAGRWSFVTEGLRARTPHLWWGDVTQIALALQGARSVGWQSEAHADTTLQSLQTLLQKGTLPPVVTATVEAPLFDDVASYCDSFSKWWRKTRIAV